MRLTVTIEAEYEEASGVPLEGLLVETMGGCSHEWASRPRSTLSSSTVWTPAATR